MLTFKGSSSVSRSAQLRNVLAEWKAGVAPIICALSMLLCFSPAATADSFNGWQGIESIMDGSEYPIPPEQDFALNYGNAAPAAVPPATLRSYIPQPGAMAPAAQSYPPIYEMAAPGQHELQGHLMQDGRQRHVRHQTASHGAQRQSGDIVPGHYQGTAYIAGPNGVAVAVPYVVPYGTQPGGVAPIIIIQQSPPSASPATAPAAAPAQPAATAGAPANAATAAPADANASKQATWKSVVNSLAGSASSAPGSLGKGMSVAAPVLNAILQGL